MNDDVEMTRRAAAGTRFAFAREPQLLSGGDASRNLHCDFAVARHAAGAAAALARLGYHTPGSAALRTGASDGEETLLKPNLALAAALRTRRRRRSGRGPGTVAALAVLLTGNLDRGLGPARRLFERNLEVVAQVGAALRPAATSRSTEQVAEAEDVAEAAENVAEV